MSGTVHDTSCPCIDCVNRRINSPAKLDPAVVEALEHAVEELETWEMFAKDCKVANADREAARLIRGLIEERK